MPFDTFIVYAAEYPSLESARTDYDAVEDTFSDPAFVAVYDAALIERKSNGKVHIVDTHEDPRTAGGALGVGVGLAAGLVATLFPAVGLGAGLLGGAVGGGTLGAIAGHVSGGMSRDDLKEIGEYLDNGEAGVIVIAAADISSSVSDILGRTTKITEHEVRIDRDLAAKEAQEAQKQDQIDPD